MLAGHFIAAPYSSPSRECLYSPGKTAEKTTVDVGLATLYPLHPAPQAENPCIMWLIQVKPLKTRQSMLDWPLYTRSIPLPRENPCIKWPVQENTSKTIVYLGLATL